MLHIIVEDDEDDYDDDDDDDEDDEDDDDDDDDVDDDDDDDDDDDFFDDDDDVDDVDDCFQLSYATPSATRADMRLVWLVKIVCIRNMHESAYSELRLATVRKY